MNNSPGAQLASQRKKVKHVCEWCGEPFIGYVTAKTCSDKCRSKKSYHDRKKSVDTVA